MLQSPGFAFSALSFILVIGPLVFIHELGHYLVGRWCGVKADVFSIGFGRELIGWTDKRGTRWKIGWLPLGGYVKFAGDMNPASTPSHEWLMLPAEERAKTFQSKAVWQRFLIVAAGPVMNFLFAIILFMGIFGVIGYPKSVAASTEITQVAPGSAAQRAGILAGDRIVSIGGREIEDFRQLAEYVVLRPGATTQVVVDRRQQQLRMTVTLADKELTDEFGNRTRAGELGVRSNAMALEKLPIQELPGKAIAQTGDMLEAIVVTLGQLVVGDRSLDDLGGPIKTAQISGQQASLGLLPLLWLMAVISVNLGFINLLPIPMLDGGHLFFYLIEGARRKPLQPEAQEWAFKAGLAALLMLMIFVTLNDLASFGLWTRLGGLIG